MHSNEGIITEDIKKLYKQKELGAWDYECAASSCLAYQLLLGDGDKQILRSEFSVIERKGKKIPRLKIIAPLGTFLPSGISVNLISQEPFIIPFQFCTDNGCFINLDLSDEIVDILKESDKLSVSYRKVDRELQETSINLLGSSEVIEELLQDYQG